MLLAHGPLWICPSELMALAHMFPGALHLFSGLGDLLKRFRRASPKPNVVSDPEPNKDDVYRSDGSQDDPPSTEETVIVRGAADFGFRLEPTESGLRCFMDHFEGPDACADCKGKGWNGMPLCGAVYTCKTCEGQGRK